MACGDFIRMEPARYLLDCEKQLGDQLGRSGRRSAWRLVPGKDDGQWNLDR